MNCSDAREWASAAQDHELAPELMARLDRHRAGCAGCRRFTNEIAALHRQVRVGPAAVEDDRTARILAALPARPAREPARVLQTTIAVIAVLQLVAAAPLLVAHDHAGAHLQRHIGVTAIAVAVGLLAVACRPVWTAAFLPMLAVLVIGLAWTCLGDILSGRAVPAGAPAHGLDLAGLAAVVALHRVRRGASAPGRGILAR